MAHHFKLIKKRHFRTVKGFKKEMQEMSLLFLLFILVVVGFSAKVTSANAAQLPPPYFWGFVVEYYPICGPKPLPPTPCKVNQAPAGEITLVGGPIPILNVTQGQSFGYVGIPKPGKWIVGNYIPASPSPMALIYWAP